MTPTPRQGPWEQAKPLLAKWLPLFGYLTAQRIGNSCCHLQRGKIQPPYSCEINAVDHCDMACRDCDHAAPAMPPSVLSPETAYADCSRLARCYRARHVKIVGGEPLLHPDLAELFRAVRRSGISRSLHLVSNGRLLERLPEAAWRQLDTLEISLYPESPLDSGLLELIRGKSRQHRVSLQLWQHDRVHVTFALQGTADDDLVGRIYRTCHKPRDGCHAVHHGFLYKCSQSLYIGHLLAGADARFEGDRVELAGGSGLRERLIDFLSSPAPLAACRYCLGHVGKVRSHAQVSRQEWLATHQHPVEELLDRSRLAAAEARGAERDRLKRPAAP